MIFFSLILIPPMFLISRRIENILKIILRTSEKNVEEQIEMMKSIVDILNSFEENYLFINYFQIAVTGKVVSKKLKNILKSKLELSLIQKEKVRVSTEFLRERIKIQKLKKKKYIFFSFSLFLFTSLFSFITFILVRNFRNIIKNPLEVSKLFIENAANLSSYVFINELLQG